MKICVIGTGYVGLVSGVCLADFGNHVVCVDTNASKVDALNSGKSPIYEPGLTSLLEKNIASGRLTFTTDSEKAFSQSQVLFIAVGTPIGENGDCDTSQVSVVVDSLIQFAKSNSKKTLKQVIVTKSTVPVGTGKWIIQRLEDQGVLDQFSIVSNPEFLREGAAIGDFFRPDRVIIGTQKDDDYAVEIMKEIYRPLYRIERPIIFTNLETSELIKYASNAFLATKISYINEIANLCEKVGADVHQVAKGMGTDGRIGRYFLHPGPGYGGSCFPKDISALSAIAKKEGIDLHIIQATDKVNKKQKYVAFDKLSQIFGEDLSQKTIGILGLAFKPNTDDVRESAAVETISALLEKGAKINVFDPIAMSNYKAMYPSNITYSKNSYDAATDADALIILTEWNDFRELDFEKLKRSMRQSIIVDVRNIYDPERIRSHGFDYYCLGR